MFLSSRSSAPVFVLFVAVALVGCSPAVDPTPSTPPTPDLGAAAAFGEALCPLMFTVAELDPRLASLRAAGASGGSAAEHAEEVDALIDEYLEVLEGLEAVPEWGPGDGLRFQLITALHGIRARLLLIADDIDDPTATAAMVDIPLIATQAMDLAMQDAVAGGLICSTAP